MCSSSPSSPPPPPPLPEPEKDNSDVVRSAKEKSKRRSSYLAGIERTNTTGGPGVTSTATTARSFLGGG